MTRRAYEFPWLAALRGMETTIQAVDGQDWYELALRSAGGIVTAHASALAPLTDPKADAFLESIRKLKPLHEEPTVERTGVVQVIFEVDSSLR